VCWWTLAFAVLVPQSEEKLPTLEEALASGRDVWAERAMLEENGASCEFFEKLLPPLRYVNASFHHYPIVLSAPESARKTRFVSNGSGVNLLARKDTWHDAGLCPVEFQFLEGTKWVGFGDDLSTVKGPSFEHGHLPVVKVSDEVNGARVGLEVFADVDPVQPRCFVQIELLEGERATVGAYFGADASFSDDDGWVRNQDRSGVVWHDTSWRFDEDQHRLVVELGVQKTAFLVLPTDAVARITAEALTEKIHQSRRRACIEYWEGVLERAARFEVPEARVNDACKATMIGILMVSQDFVPNYSAQNLYQQTFESECGDAVIALAQMGLADTFRRLEPLLHRPLQSGIEFHDVAFKLQLLAQHYRLVPSIDNVQDGWKIIGAEVERAIGAICKDNGLLPKEAYCGDVQRKVVNLSSNADLWRGLRDLGAVLEEIGERRSGRRLLEVAHGLRPAILDAVSKSERTDFDPPFVPNALFGEEAPYETLTSSMLGSYWCLMSPYVLGSGVFGIRSQRSRSILDFLEERGGLCMGMVRFHQHSGLFANEDAVDDLYTLRYFLELLEWDEPERAIASFYGKLAQGFTRDTYVSAEGTGLRPLDTFGRSMYLPPNISSAAMFLSMLRSLLVQDCDEDDDGRPETLKLLYATPRPWLEDGKTIVIEDAPTSFGPVNLRVQSRLRENRIEIDWTPPPRRPEALRLRLRLPGRMTLTDATANGQPVSVGPDGSIDLSRLRRRTSIGATLTNSSR